MDLVWRSFQIGTLIYSILQFHVILNFEAEALFKYSSFGGDHAWLLFYLINADA